MIEPLAILTKPRKQDQPDTYEKGRRCIEHACITILSVYNGGPWCFLHAQVHEAELIEAERERCINPRLSKAHLRELAAA